MQKTEILLIVNSVLLGIISLMFIAISYFFKDLHKDFKVLIERVNKLYSDLYSHINLYDTISKVFQKQIDSLENKIEQLKKK
jgi:DNA anti-recombination protein RmuC